MAHARLSASKSSRWLTCPASIQAEERVKDVFVEIPSPKAIEGTLAHALAEHCLIKGESPIYYADQMLEDKLIDVEMAEKVQGYVEYIENLRLDLAKYELRIDLRRWIPDGFGTSDVVGYNKETKTLHVVDLKYGMIKVLPNDNPQLKLYALGALYTLNEDVETVTLHIYQPRVMGKTASSWDTTPKELYKFGSFVKTKALEALDPNPEYNPTDEACQWCRAKGDCPALRDITLDAFEVIKDELEIDDEKAVELYEKANLICMLKDSLGERIKSKIQSGSNVKGYTIVTSKRNRIWTDEEKVKDLLGERAFEKKLISPTKALKIKDVPKEIEELIMTPEGEQKLARAKD